MKVRRGMLEDGLDAAAAGPVVIVAVHGMSLLVKGSALNSTVHVVEEVWKTLRL